MSLGEKSYEIIDLEQGSEAWLNLRKTKITATDASVIMGINPWKTPLQLYNEKLSTEHKNIANARMQRGTDLEPIGRSLFILQTGIEVEPKVVVSAWAMASLDGLSKCGKYAVEIKCPAEKDHALALAGKVPPYYYPQLQHQMWVCCLSFIYYFSFDGIDGVYVKVHRDEAFIEKMISQEYVFYLCLQNKTPPETGKEDYIERKDALWEQCAAQWQSTNLKLKELEELEETLRKQLIFLSGGSNAKGAGISLCQVQRKGAVDYAKIPQLKNIDLEQYRKEGGSSWRISQM